MPIKFDSTERFLEAVDYLKGKGIIKSSRELCKQIGISPSLISEARNGRTKIALTKLIRLSELYRQISRDYLIDGTGYMVVNEPEGQYTHRKLEFSFDNSAEYAMKKTIEAQDQTIKSLQEVIINLRKEIERLGGQL